MRTSTRGSAATAATFAGGYERDKIAGHRGDPADRHAILGTQGVLDLEQVALIASQRYDILVRHDFHHVQNGRVRPYGRQPIRWDDGAEPWNPGWHQNPHGYSVLLGQCIRDIRQ